VTIGIMALSIIVECSYSMSFVLNVTYKPFMLCLIMLNVTECEIIVFVLGKPFQTSLMFVGKAGAYPSEAHFCCST
jgi:hypothetical protein